MITRRSRLCVIALSLLILTSYVYFPSDGGSAASAPAELFRKVPANSAVLVFINRADHKLCLRLTSGKGLSSLSLVGDSQASAELLKFVRSVWKGSGDGSNVRPFIIRGASANSNQKKVTQAELPVFKLAGYPNAEWMLTVVPVKRLDRSAIRSSTLPSASVGTTPTPTPAPTTTPSPSGSGSGVEGVAYYTVYNGDPTGRGAPGFDTCDPFADIYNYSNLDQVPGTDLGSHATIFSGARGGSAWAMCSFF